jgi:hypothetical protein
MNKDMKLMLQIRKEHEIMIEKIDANDWGDIPMNLRQAHLTAVHYVHGYSMSYLDMVKKIMNLMDMDEDQITDWYAEEKRLTAETDKLLEETVQKIRGGR